MTPGFEAIVQAGRQSTGLYSFCTLQISNVASAVDYGTLVQFLNCGVVQQALHWTFNASVLASLMGSLKGYKSLAKPYGLYRREDDTSG